MLTKVLDEINFTEDTRSSARTFPKATLQKVDSYFSKEETFLSVDSSTKFFEQSIQKEEVFKVPKVKTMLGKRSRLDENVDQELNELFANNYMNNFAKPILPKNLSWQCLKSDNANLIGTSE